MIGGEKVSVHRPGSLLSEDPKWPDENPKWPDENPEWPDEMDVEMASDGKNQRYQTAPNEAVSQYHLVLTISTLRWLLLMFERLMKGTKFPAYCLSDSKADPILIGLIRQLHVLFRNEEASDQEMRGRKTARTPTPDSETGESNAGPGSLPLALRRARRGQSAPTRTERIHDYQEMLRFVREQPLIAASLQPSPTSSWRAPSPVEGGEGLEQQKNQEFDPIDLWEPEPDMYDPELWEPESDMYNPELFGQGGTQSVPEGMDLFEPGVVEGEGNKGGSEQQEHQPGQVKTEVVEVQPSDSDNDIPGDEQRLSPPDQTMEKRNGEDSGEEVSLPLSEMSLDSPPPDNGSISSSFDGDETLLE